MDSTTGFCAGCLRTLDEIMAWRDASDGFRRVVLDRIRTRRKAGHRTTRRS